MKIVLKKRPKPYLLTEQQKKFKQALEHCGIRKGITRADLVVAMVNCIPEFFRDEREENQDL